MDLDNYIAPQVVPFWDTDAAKELVTCLETIIYSALGTGKAYQGDEGEVTSALSTAGSLGIFGSSSIGQRRPDSDFDVVVLTNKKHLVGNYKLDMEGLPALDVVVHTPDCDHSTFPLASHLAEYAQWKPREVIVKGMVCDGMLMGHTYKYVAPTILRLPYMPAAVKEGTEEWYVRTYRELLRCILELRGHSVPPSRTLDLLWENPKVRDQARVVAQESYGMDVYDRMFDCRLAYCGQCKGIAIDTRAERAGYGPLWDKSLVNKMGSTWNSAHNEFFGPQLEPSVQATEAWARRLDELSPDKRIYFCSDSCRNRWATRQTLSGERSWIVLPNRNCAYVKPARWT